MKWKCVRVPHSLKILIKFYGESIKFTTLRIFISIIQIKVWKCSFVKTWSRLNLKLLCIQFHLLKIIGIQCSEKRFSYMKNKNILNLVYSCIMKRLKTKSVRKENSEAPAIHCLHIVYVIQFYTQIYLINENAWIYCKRKHCDFHFCRGTGNKWIIV